jgi:glycosyltransferase involved in cell wall biosynthesis
MTKVSIIVPCLNEERTIRQLLAAIYVQDIPRADMEVLIADGRSTDGTREEISRFQHSHPDLDVQVIDNPRRLIPTGLNLAISAAKSSVILRLDAHCVPWPEYIRRSLEALESGKGWCVGGVWEIRPGGKSFTAASIALAASHPLGVGDAFYRFTTKAREVDTVPFGAFNKDLVSRIGGFDETLHANEDYQFNTRVRQSGGKVWLDPAIRSTYFARPTLTELGRQYARYGYWKSVMLRRYPNSLRLRQIVPPLFVISLLVLPLGGLVWPWLHWVLLAEVVSYALLLFTAAFFKALEVKKIELLVGIPIAMATMHLSWGVAFLWSLLTHRARKV